MYMFRLGQPADIPAILALTGLWAGEQLDTTGNPEHNSAEDVQEWIGPYWWVAEHEHEVVGFVVGLVNGDSNVDEHDQILEQDEEYLSLDQLYVHPEHRDRGVGGRLVDRLLAEADARGLQHVLVHSDNRDWQRTAAFYQRHGFGMWFIKLVRTNER